jgi:hypothetical protein
VLDKGAQKERDSDLAQALRKIREEALGRFTRNPENGEAIYDEITQKVMAQVATRATQNALRNVEGGGANHAQAFLPWAQAYALFKKYCYRKIFSGRCGIPQCAFDHGSEGEVELRKDLGDEGFEARKAQFLERQARQKAKRDTKESSNKTANNHEAKDTGTVDKGGARFTLSAPARARGGFGFHAQSLALEGEATDEAQGDMRGRGLIDVASAVIDFIIDVNNAITAATNVVRHACASMHAYISGSVHASARNDGIPDEGLRLPSDNTCAKVEEMDLSDADSNAPSNTEVEDVALSDAELPTAMPMVPAPPLMCYCGPIAPYPPPRHRVRARDA